MIRDDIFREFLKHDIIQQDDVIKTDQLPNTVSEGLQSDVPIIKAIAKIVEIKQDKGAVSDIEIYRQIAYTLKTSIAT